MIGLDQRQVAPDLRQTPWGACNAFLYWGLILAQWLRRSAEADNYRPAGLLPVEGVEK